MNWAELGAALALVCIIEGLVPFANPAGMRRLFTRLAAMTDGELRIGGLVSMGVGLVILFLVRS
jgi:uncharacterized protein YjeT (DUF2065 family)